MGNQLTQPSRLAAAEAVADLGGSVTYTDSLGEVPLLAAAAATADCRLHCCRRHCCRRHCCRRHCCRRHSVFLLSLPHAHLRPCGSPGPAGGGRFFKSALCVHDEGGLVVVKVRRTPVLS